VLLQTRDLLHIINARHGTQSRTILGSPAGQQADGDHAGCKTAAQMPSGAEPVTGSLFEICA
jgi:hypothetical protein